MAAPAVQSDETRTRSARPPLPRLRDVLAAQLRVTGLALRGPALVGAALLALCTLWVALQVAGGQGAISAHAWPTQLPGVVGMLLPIAVWARDERFGPAFLWTLPVDRRRHALTKVVAGWVWLMAGIALFVLWLLAITSATGGRALPAETLHVLTSASASSGPLEPSTLRTVLWAPGPLLWVVPFTAATGGYLAASALALGSRHPLRWVIGAVVAYVLLSIASSAISAELGVTWLADGVALLLEPLLLGRYGLDALLTARIESLSNPGILSTGERIMLWSAVPDLAEWGITVLLWTGAGSLALWAAASRHRERRRA